MNISINSNDRQISDQVIRKSSEKSKDQKSNIVYAGNLSGRNNPVNEKLENAKKQAFKLVSDAWDSDRDFQKKMKELRDFISEKKAEKSDAEQRLSGAYETADALKKEYQIDDESTEQKDLEWLISYEKGLKTGESFKDIEQMKKDSARAKEIRSNFTDYQHKMYEINGQIENATKIIDDAKKSIMAARQSLTDAESENNKQHTMVDAVKEGEQIMAAANKDVIGIVFDDAIEKKEEEIREDKEKQEEKKEEKEDKEKLAAERLEKKEIQEALASNSKAAVSEAQKRGRERKRDDLELSDISNTNPEQVFTKSGETQAALDEIKNKMALVDADLKGLKVDETL